MKLELPRAPSDGEMVLSPEEREELERRVNRLRMTVCRKVDERVRRLRRKWDREAREE